MGLPNTRIWLHDTDHRRICGLLRSYQLAQYDTNGMLTESSGTTDLRIDLGNARSDPESTRLIAGWFRKPIEHLQPDRFVEIPDALSGVAGHLSTVLRMPYLSIRAKSTDAPGGRFSERMLLGECHAGDQVAIIDDQIRDGAAQLAAIRTCLDHRLHVLAIVVLIDQDEGWRAAFAAAGVRAPVWAGMTITETRTAFRGLDTRPTIG